MRMKRRSSTASLLSVTLENVVTNSSGERAPEPGRRVTGGIDTPGEVRRRTVDVRRIERVFEEEEVRHLKIREIRQLSALRVGFSQSSKRARTLLLREERVVGNHSLGDQRID